MAAPGGHRTHSLAPLQRRPAEGIDGREQHGEVRGHDVPRIVDVDLIEHVHGEIHQRQRECRRDVRRGRADAPQHQRHRQQPLPLCRGREHGKPIEHRHVVSDIGGHLRLRPVPADGMSQLALQPRVHVTPRHGAHDGRDVDCEVLRDGRGRGGEHRASAVPEVVRQRQEGHRQDDRSERQRRADSAAPAPLLHREQRGDCHQPGHGHGLIRP